MEFDAALIEASFAMQYGIRLSQEDIAFGEFSRLLAGLMADTPLGKVVAVRAEKDAARIRDFGAYERGLRKAWRGFLAGRAEVRSGDWAVDIARLQDALLRAFS